VAVLACAAAGCGATSTPGTTALHLRADQRPTPIGVGLRYRIPPVSRAIEHHALAGGYRCVRSDRLTPPYGVHLELFANRRVVPVPAGIGVAPPQRRNGAYVLGGRCDYALRTLEPTGVIRVSARAPKLGDLFAIWGQPLTDDRLAGFAGDVLAFVDGRPWTGPPAAIPLRRHAEIVLEIGGRIPPHPTYTFPPGL
jgi:hypothetical protein